MYSPFKWAVFATIVTLTLFSHCQAASIGNKNTSMTAANVNHGLLGHSCMTNCPENSVCIERTCYCKFGYRPEKNLNGYTTCTKIECYHLFDVNKCPPNSHCKGILFNKICECDAGYSVNEIQQCTSESHLSSRGFIICISIVGVLVVIGIFGCLCYCCCIGAAASQGSTTSAATAGGAPPPPPPPGYPGAPGGPPVPAAPYPYQQATPYPQAYPPMVRY